ncbi:dihydroorotate dehydrogenase electron transfer subunit [Motilibacter aurantiacus]|uniref:dihydroorotate dehydrogenase electron transfer subunit n=1 Tax=Motilibacter aurantiacus TaxID=2714955 RepID=UPI001407584D|nr:dihydroorotate dehydrogenase electron transfer subunit [Motilibacter aurantiacus]NHC45992.1 dihydroorotate dehydrogenase electron transfer subunit [Motilibacter aurantiacus]
MTVAPSAPLGGVVQVRGEVLSVRRVGAYAAITLLAPGVAERFRPGHFVALAIGDQSSSMLLRRSFSIHRCQERGVYGGTVEIVVSAHGPGTQWLASRRPHDPVDVVGPLGTPFALPKEPASCALVGGGYGSAPLFTLAERLRARGCRVDIVLGAATEERLFGVLEAKRMADSVTVTTDDGSLGIRGRVTDALPRVIERAATDVVYACGPMAMLRAVSDVAAGAGIPAQVAVEEAMACGIGVCMTCVLPVVGEDGVTRMVRSCTEGPVFRGESVRWADVGTVPADCLGAPVAAGGH